jgi:hypothetical protein
MRTTPADWLSPPQNKDQRRALLLGRALGMDLRQPLADEQRPAHAIFVTLALVAATFVAMVAAS